MMDDLEHDEQPGENANRYRAPALEKGLDIIQLLSTERIPLSLSAICARLERSQGEIFRMVQVLNARGFIAQDPSNDGYILTDMLFSMAMRQPATQSLVEIALPVMRRLSTEVGQSCHLAFHSRGDMVIVARMESAEQIGFSVRVGYRLSLPEANSGRVLYAFQPEDVRKRWLTDISPKLDAGGLAEFNALADKIVADGHGRSASSFVNGVTDIAVPILRGERAAAALAIPYLHIRDDRPDIDAAMMNLEAAAIEISASLISADNCA